MPEPTLQFTGIDDFLAKYQPKAEDAGVDPLGYYLPPYAYAYLQILGQAVEDTGSLDQDVLANHIRTSEFDTVVGTVAFGSDGEWRKTRVLMIQFQNLQGKNLEQFTKSGTRVVLYPSEWSSGEASYPYHAGAK